MASLHIACVSAAAWKWFCRCPDAIGPIYDISNDEESYTPPTTPLRHRRASCRQYACLQFYLDVRDTCRAWVAFASTKHSTQATISLGCPTTHNATSCCQASPHGQMLAYQQPIRVYRPSWPISDLKDSLILRCDQCDKRDTPFSEF